MILEPLLSEVEHLIHAGRGERQAIPKAMGVARRLKGLHVGVSHPLLIAGVALLLTLTDGERSPPM